MKLPIRYDHIHYEGDFFYDADGDELTAQQLVDAINGASTHDPLNREERMEMELAEVVMKLVGPVKAVGEHNEDQRRMENLKVLTEVVEVLLNRIEDVAVDAERPEASMKAIGLYARNALRDVRGE